MPKRKTNYPDLGVDLNAKLAEALASDPEDGLDLREELALIREMATLNVSVYAARRESFVNMSDTDKKTPGEMMRQLANLQQFQRIAMESIKLVMDAAAEVCHIENQRKGLPAQVVEHLLNGIRQVLQLEVGDDQASVLLDKIESSVFAGLTKSKALGTLLRPDLDAMAMDDTIPK